MTENKSIVDYYRARALEYEQIYYREVPARRNEIDDCCEYVRQISKDKVILDLACGTGYWTKVASDTAKSIIATDISIEMLNQARLKQLLCPTAFVAANMYELPFLPNSFDLLILGFWLSHEPRQNYDSLFNRLVAQIKPNGRIWMIDNNPPAEGPHIDSAGTDQFGNNLKYRKLQNGNQFVIVKNYFSRNALIEILSSRFSIIDLVHKEYYWSVQLALK
jgi:demethylmenaquinone methyltransferase/2-methoxy-6-polyprenyl-1,4-benzoquinol methylase